VKTELEPSLIFGTGIRIGVPNFLGTGTGIRTGSRVLKLLATRTGIGIGMGMGTRPTTQNPEPVPDLQQDFFSKNQT
jgi:hypothetical protein